MNKEIKEYIFSVGVASIGYILNYYMKDVGLFVILGYILYRLEGK